MYKVMVGVTEYGEGMDVKLWYDKGRPVIVALNESGCNATFVDLNQLLEWVDKNMPEFKREWVGLTDEEIDLLEELYAPPVHPDFVNDADHCLELIRHIEAKLKDKNT